MPSNVTGMLKYGTNLLQAVGQFNGKLLHVFDVCIIVLFYHIHPVSDSAITILGHYIIVVAFMSIASSLDTPVLKDYVQPIVPSPYSGVLNRTSNHYIDVHFNI